MAILLAGTMLLGGAAAALAQSGVVFRDNFDGYADDAALRSAWLGGVSWPVGADGLRTDRFVSSPQSYYHPGGCCRLHRQFAGSGQELLPSDTDPILWKFDMYDDGGASKRFAAELHAAVNGAWPPQDPWENTEGWIDIGTYNTADFYWIRTVFMGGPVCLGGGWCKIDNIGVPRSIGWHSFRVEIAASTIKVWIDDQGPYVISGLDLATEIQQGFNIAALGSPSDVSSTAGGGNFDNIHISYLSDEFAGPTCYDVPVVQPQGILYNNQISVGVSPVDATATAVTLYNISGASPVVIATNTSPTAGTTTFDLTSNPLQNGWKVVATQTMPVGDPPQTMEGCIPISGTIVGDCNQISPVTVTGIYVAGMTQVTVQGVSADATSVSVYANGAAPAIGTNNSPTEGTTTVTVSSLVNGQVISATQTISNVEGCIPQTGLKVGDCSQIPAVRIVGMADAGRTVVYVKGVDPTATKVSVYDDPQQPAIGTNSSPGGQPVVSVTVTALVEGNTISATQTLPVASSELEGCPGQNERRVMAAGMIDDFEDGIIDRVNPPDAPTPAEDRAWYNIRSDTYGTLTRENAVGVFTSHWIRVRDSGWRNGEYAVYEHIIPASGLYHITADMLVNETDVGANPDAIRQYQIGVVLNGAHRASDASLAAISNVGSYWGLTPQKDGFSYETETQELYTGPFTAQAGDSLLIAISTHLEDAEHQSNTTWYLPAPAPATPAYMMLDNIRLGIGVHPPTCREVEKVVVNSGPLEEAGTSVRVSNISISPAAELVTVYATVGETTTQIGQVNPSGNTAIDVAVDPPLEKGQIISATQTISANEGCILTVPTAVGVAVVGSGTNTGLRLSLGIRENTALTGPIGEDGGESGAIEWLAATGQADGAPLGGKLLSPSMEWQTVTFYPVALGEIPADDVEPFTTWTTPAANGVLDGTFGVLEHLALTADPDSLDTGRYVLYIDNVMNGPVGSETVIADFEDPFDPENPLTPGMEHLFQEPTHSSTTGTNLLTGTAIDVAQVSDVKADTGTQSYKVVFQFKDEATKRWVRLATTNADPHLKPNPMINLAHPITMRILLQGFSCNDPFADADGDGDVDQDDFAAFQACISGSDPAPAGCECFDRAGGPGIDQDDWGPFEACASGPDVPADTSCDGGS